MKRLIIWVVVSFFATGAVAWFLLANPARDTAPEQVAPTDAAETPEPAEPTEPEATTSPASEPDVSADYVGLSVAEAQALATANDVPFRVVERDGEMLPTTRDYRPGRINATVEAGVVVAYDVEGAEAGRRGVGEGDPDANRYDFGEPATPDTDTEEGQHDEILGMTVAEAEAYAEANEVPFRVGSIDGEPRGLTMDYRPGRITADVADGVVTDYSVE